MLLLLCVFVLTFMLALCFDHGISNLTSYSSLCVLALTFMTLRFDHSISNLHLAMYYYMCGLAFMLTVCFNHSTSNLIFDLSFFAHYLFCLAVRAPDQEPPPQHHFPVVGSSDAFHC